MLLPPSRSGARPSRVKEIEVVVSKIARIPPKTVSKNDSVDPKASSTINAEARGLTGKDPAIEAAGLGDQTQRVPACVSRKNRSAAYLFAGPTGVGKTEVARNQLAGSHRPSRCMRFDMSEYMERNTRSARLIGAPPGYVGFDQGGLLTDGVDKDPHCVLLLDEIEKAHPDLFNILLQVMDHGKLTDHNGKSVDFRNVILIMTTNAGASELAKAAIGFSKSTRDGDDMEAINRLFAPEFRNRLDAIVAFGHLPPEVVNKVVQKFVLQLEAQLADRGVTFDLSEEAVKWLAKKRL